MHRSSALRRAGAAPAVRTIAVLLSMAALSACTHIKLIADYDEVIDKSATESSKKVEGFFTKLERATSYDEVSYLKSTSFYDDIRADLRTMRVRAGAVPKNSLTVQQVDLLIQNIDALEKIHKLHDPQQKLFTAEELAPMRTAFSQQFMAIIKLELAKKRGEESSE